MHNPYSLAPKPILVHQLHLVMNNFRITLVVIPLCLIIWYTLENPQNNAALTRWAVGAISANLLLQAYGWYHLNHGFTQTNVRSKTYFYALLHGLDGFVWGLLSWFILGTVSESAAVIIVAIFSGLLAAGLATLSAIPILFIAFALPHTIFFSAALFLSGNTIFQSMAMIGVLYLISLSIQVVISSKVITTAITTRLDLEESNHKLREIERSQTLQKERQRLMQDMHDGLGSSLLSALRVVEKGNMPSQEVAQVLKECIDDLKLAIDSIEPVDQDLLLLLATLRFRIGTRLENSGINLRWNVTTIPPLEWLDPTSSLHALRILQEALTNIIKHSGADEVSLSTHSTETQVFVEIADNGCGFDPQSAPANGGRGLLNQSQRATAIGAEIRWVTRQRGSCMQLVLPIKKKRITDFSLDIATSVD